MLTLEELDDDKILEALEKTPVFKREGDFNPRAYQADVPRRPTTLFD